MPGFEEIVGHEQIVTHLKSAMKLGKVSHAYILSGEKGCGKKLLADVFAETLQCEKGGTEPCGSCHSCVQAQSGNHPDIIHLMHEKPNSISVDDVRTQIVNDVLIKPYSGKYKIYIIDEVHMMTSGAFNALLKTLEEPPEYVIFILATTEAHKIPITILSRCQRYDFKRISIETIAARLRELIDKEGWDVEDKAVRYIAKMADGSMRDSLSLLDQCAAFYMNETLTYDHVLEVLGAVDTEVFSRLLRQLLAMDVHQVIETVDELVMQGRELSQLAADFTWYLRNLLLVKSSDNMEDVLDVSSENLALLKEEAQMIDSDTLIRYIRIFSDLTNQLKYATQKRVLLEVTLIKLCRPAMDQNKDALLDRIRAIEKQLEEGAWEAPVRERIVYASDAKEAGEPKPKPELPQALNEDVKAVAKDFRMIINEASPMLRTYLKKARLSAGEGNRLLIVLPDELSASAVATPEHKEEIQSLIEQKIGKKVEIDVRQMEAGRRFEDNFVDLENLINMEITVEDE